MIVTSYNEWMQHLMPPFTFPWGSAAASTQMPSLLLGYSFPTWRQQKECEFSKQKSLRCSCHLLAGPTQWGQSTTHLTKTRERSKQKICFPASEKRLCALSVSGIALRNIVLLPYLSHKEQLLIPPPQKSLWLVSTFFFTLAICKISIRN